VLEILSDKCKAERKVDHGQKRATLNYAGRNWDDQKGKFELGIEEYKERNPAKKKRMDKAVEP